MARPKKDLLPEGQATPLPESFPPDTMFVAVSEHDKPAAGFDGGPERGGRGAWGRGTTGQWTADHTVPLALRDPKDGLIVRGYLEPVIGQDAMGRVVTQKFFAVRKEDGTWEAAVPTARALKRANLGADSVAKAFETVPQRRAVMSGLSL